MFKIKNYIALHILIFFIVSNIFSYSIADEIKAPNAQIPSLEIATPSAILIDAKTGQILFEKNSNEKMYPASITKTMTALLAIERGNLNSKVIISKKAVSISDSNSSSAGLLEGEELTLEQLLYAMLLNSANEASNAIAETIGGSIENFASIMNQRAKELGAKNSNFVNPNGLPNPDHYVSAYDMAMIAKQAMTLPEFRKIVSTESYVLPMTNKMQEERPLHNGNKLINKDYGKYYYPYAIGVKTGYTTLAGSTLVSAANKDGMELIAVVLNSPIDGSDSYMYIDSKRLFDYGFENFVSCKMVNKNQILDTLKVKGSRTLAIAVPQDEFSIILPKNQDRNTVKVTKQYNQLSVPIKKGDIVGYISYDDNGKFLGKINIISDNDVKESNFTGLSMPKEKTFLTITWLMIKWILLILFIIIFSFIAIIVIYNSFRNHMRKTKIRR